MSAVAPLASSSEKVEELTLEKLADQMREKATKHPRLRLSSDKPVEFFRRHWGDMVLVLVLNPTSWVLSVRRKDRDPTIAQMAALERAFHVPRNATTLSNNIRLGADLWLTTKYAWNRRKRR